MQRRDNSYSGAREPGIAGMFAAGAQWVWTARRANELIQRGNAVATATVNNVSATNDAGVTVPTGDGRFRQVEPHSVDPGKVLGPMGDFGAKITNYWEDNASQDRGIQTQSAPIRTTEYGITGTSEHVIQSASLASGIPRIDTSRVGSAPGTQWVERAEIRSSTYYRALQFLVKPLDGQSPAGRIWPHCYTGPGRTGSNEAQPFVLSIPVPNSDGWWWVMTAIKPSATTSVYMGLTTSGLVDCYVEAPMQYSLFTSDPMVPRAPILTFGSNASRPTLAVTIESQPGQNEPIGSSGWIAMSLCLPYGSTYTDWLAAPTIPSATLLEMDIDASNWHKIGFSTSLRKLYAQSRRSGLSVLYLDGPTVWDRFESIGLCFHWGENNGARFGHLTLNGNKMESDVSVSGLPIGDPSTLVIGADGTLGNGADCWINAVARGWNQLTRNEGRTISRVARQLNPMQVGGVLA